MQAWMATPCRRVRRVLACAMGKRALVGRAVVLLLVAPLLLAGLASCNIVGPAIALAQGPPMTEALHTLDPARSVVVFVDNRDSVLPRGSLRLSIARRTERLLLDEAKLKQVIDASAIIEAASRESPDAPTDIATLGRAVKADAVVYVVVDTFALSPDGQTYLPSADVRVKVIDTSGQGSRAWPEDRAGHAMRVTMPASREVVPTSAAALTRAQDKLAEAIGVSVAKLFYEHETRSSLSETR